jgi:hypothetical protein
MSDPSCVAALRDIVPRHIWLLSELHAGNEFSKDQLWRWLKEAEATRPDTPRDPVNRP